MVAANVTVLVGGINNNAIILKCLIPPLLYPFQPFRSLLILYVLPPSMLSVFFIFVYILDLEALGWGGLRFNDYSVNE